MNSTYRDIFGADAPYPPRQQYRDVYRAMGGSTDALAALVGAGVVGPGATLADLDTAGVRLHAELNDVEQESEAADAEAALEAIVA